MRSHGRRTIVTAGPARPCGLVVGVASASRQPIPSRRTGPMRRSTSRRLGHHDRLAGDRHRDRRFRRRGRPRRTRRRGPAGLRLREGDRVAAPVDVHGTGVTGRQPLAQERHGRRRSMLPVHVLPLQVVGPDGIASTSTSRKPSTTQSTIARRSSTSSLVGPNSTPVLEGAVTRARAAGVLVVAAAGNEATDIPQFPAGTPGALSVGASTRRRRAGFSNHGPWVRFAAPECAPIAVLGGGSGVGCGTSMSSPLVAGSWRSCAPGRRTPRQRTSRSPARAGRRERHGVRRPRAAAALRSRESAASARPGRPRRPGRRHSSRRSAASGPARGGRGVPVGALSRG